MNILVLPTLLAQLPSITSIPPPLRVSNVLGRVVSRRDLPQAQPLQQQQNAVNNVETHFFKQRLDHFSNDTISTFQQRFFYSSRYASSSSGGSTRANRKNENMNVAAASSAAPLAFLCVGGEGSNLDMSVLIDSVHCTGDMIELAKKLHVEHGREVHLFALEHRYYGKSFPNATAVDYSFLSSRQAVRDIISFVQSSEVQQLMTRGKRSVGNSNDTAPEQSIKISPPEAPSSSSSSSTIFITFGGSYPGMIAAWSRLLHPETIFAAVSNSAPIQARLEFPEYYERVGYDLENVDIGGSALCRSIVEEGHAQVVSILEGGRQNNSSSSSSLSGDEDGDSIREYDLDKVATLFNVCGGSEMLRASRRNMESFVGGGLIEISAQDNNPHCKGELCNIEKLCSKIVKKRKLNPTKPSMEILALISMLQNQFTCNSVDWSTYLDYYSSPSTEDDANEKSWLYQTCAEFGFYMTCNRDSQCPFGRGYNDISRHFELCKFLFGIDPDTAKRNVNSTLSYYGGLNLTPNTGEISSYGSGQKRIIFVNGDVDPWTALALTDGTDDHPSFLVRGASHHFWTHSVKDNDGVFIVNARRAIYSIVSDWLGESMLGTTGMGDWSLSTE